MNEESPKTTTIGEIPLDQRISFRIQRTGTLLTTQAVGLLKQAGGLTLNQWRLLSFLSERESGSVHEFSKFGSVDKATLSRVSAELLKRGLIASEVSATDRRAAVLRLTGAGRDALASVAPLMIARQAELIDALTIEERHALFRILEKLEDAIRNSALETQ